ncbi:hypothetical protein ICY20_26425 [Pseudomonas sp. P115]|uniref:hypothetical protein n=1 Tax=Pseudomonas pisciculturae TaxID=2730413 RepID=UPI0018921F04|nr:hypothetical protein [Pseudomonas pisciculturae]MBF6031296.1 hypothetical protein [Pseudomonas pisciculturae]
MSYLDDEVIEDFKKNDIPLTILPKQKHDLIVKEINNSIPFHTCNIAWELLEGSTYLGDITSDTSIDSLAEKIKKTTDNHVIILGDSTDNAYSINVKDIYPALQIFSTIPQHTFITFIRLGKIKWIAGLSFEGNMYFSNL